MRRRWTGDRRRQPDEPASVVSDCRAVRVSPSLARVTARRHVATGDACSASGCNRTSTKIVRITFPRSWYPVQRELPAIIPARAQTSAVSNGPVR